MQWLFGRAPRARSRPSNGPARHTGFEIIKSGVNWNGFAALGRFPLGKRCIFGKSHAKLSPVSLLAHDIDHEGMGRLVRRAGKSLDAPLEIIRDLQTGGCHKFDIDIARSPKLLPRRNEVNVRSSRRQAYIDIV
jgi:hypothetical protein